MAAIRVTKRTCKKIEVSRPSHIKCIGSTEFFYIETYRVVFIYWLRVHNRLSGCELIRVAYFFIHRYVTTMTCLKHIKRKPVVLVKPLRRAKLIRLGMKADNGPVIRCLHYRVSHSLPNFYIAWSWN